MDQRIADIRKDYTKRVLNRQETVENPIEQFRRWFKEAQEAEVPEINAMNLSTVGKNGRPSARIVLLKDITEKGFVFYTNYQSRKGKELEEHPFAALTFFWPELERQVRVEGKIKKVDQATAEAYFSSRPRGSQLGAWASPQSQEIDKRGLLEVREKEFEERFAENPIPKPEHWGGYELIPDYVEFWQGRSSRLHDRIAYDLVNGTQWQRKRLAP
ncbi:pyridoxamine 5'-phosphate oxidase [Nafulsella turpanensis]|uniref:pyridoxamine 5'-phosphate oxidase n=1 Tax=Nafulsella turpanensis TaxID=1265690 RepID=UPI00034D313B|nr:pyridoxamine 5'-phosphate oxidase [Nafulsella turpanensis]